MSLSKSISVTLDGAVYTGTYRVDGERVAVTSVMGAKDGIWGRMRAAEVAKALLAGIVYEWLLKSRDRSG